MTSLGDNLDPSGGKVIRIVSLDEEGHYLSLSDGSQMQILNQDLGISSDNLTSSDSVLAMQGSDAVSVSSGATLPTSILSFHGGTGMMMTGGGNTITTIANNGGSNNISENAHLVTLQSTADNPQPHLVALPQGATISTEALQKSGLLGPDGSINSELGFQTITIMPSDLNQSGDMNYVFIMAPTDGSKDGTQQLAQVLDLKQENQEYSEELMEINGEVKRVLRVVPKKCLPANFGTQLMCDYCDYTSPKRYLLTRHMKSHSDERPHKCKECDRGFKTPASLMNHVNTHTGIRPHKCKTCEAAFTTSGELVRHIRYRHTFEKPHRCPNCDYASVELSKLKRHMRSHTGERPYKCPHCPYASPDTYKLKRHLRIHTGEKPYECDICHTRFTQSNSLKAHKLIHSGNKPVFQCNLCPTTCGRKTDLKIHFNKLHSVGSPLECKKCGEVFSDRYSYKQHVRGHDIDKCYKCEDCDFIANTERSFDAHAAIHSNGKKFECDTCHTSFNLEQTLLKHQKFCQMGEDSECESSRDKESDDQSVDKTPVYKSTLGRPSQQSKADALLKAESSHSSLSGHLVAGGPLTSDTLHRNLLQDIKAGKLGDVPQVVIVHPDGSFEEISSKIPMGDKLNIEDIFSALSNNDKIVGLDTAGESNSRTASSDGAASLGDKRKDSGKLSNCDDDNLSDEDDNDENENEDDLGETMQCEASTQAELESDTDTDSMEGGQMVEPISPKETRNALPNGSPDGSVLDQSEISDSNSAPLSEAASEAVPSLLHVITTSTSPSSLLTTTSDQNTVVNPQYVVVKGYTCLSSDAGGQPTLVNVAVDRDSLMKMFASLGSNLEGGMQLLAGDLDSMSLPMEGSQASVITMTQEHLNEFSGVTSHGDGTAMDHQLDSDAPEIQDTSKTSGNEISFDGRLKDDVLILSDHSKSSPHPLSDDALSMGESQHNMDNSLPKLLLSTHFTSQPTKSSVPSQPDSAKDSSLVEKFPSEQNIDVTSTLTNSIVHIASSESFSYSVNEDAGDSSLEIFQSSEKALATQESPTPSLLSINTKRKPTGPGALLSHYMKDIKSEMSDDKDEDSLRMNDLSAEDDIIKKNSSSLDKQKRYNRKRPTAADPSLVMTGKRVRKALVKVSM
ncbi:unnamed protein product [Lymnaea stagnalis]|uniref:C2H2-type domain-containing protein n=1 Tax=Lymnaea stagnalis TaxID=6523 RepID=A0AAV2HSZ6_LYMST